ncbi:MAG: outer membrane lipoprotein-sorting protein [Candidatus Aminicenantales bacterium]
MKKRIILGLLATFVVFGSGLPAQDLTVADVLAKSIEAQGGRATMAAIKDTTTSGTMELIQMGMSAALTIYQKEPNKMRMDIDIMGMIITTAFDGEKGWMVNPQTGVAEAMNDKQSRAQQLQAMGYEAALNPEKFGITYVLKGKETVGDKECYVLEQTFKDWTQATVYVNAATFLTEKTWSKSDETGTEVIVETVMSDYKNIEGLMVPHSLTIFQGGAEFGRISIGKVAFNTGLEDAFFKMQ